MSKKFSHSRFSIHCLNAGIVALLLAFLVPLSANASSHVSNYSQSTCLQAPANLDPRKLSESQLEVYGLPLRPPSSEGPQAQARWLQLANRIKLDHHNCNPQRVTGPHAHQPTILPSKQYRHSAVTPYAAQAQYAWAGYADTGSPGSFSFSSANWNLPCMNTSVRSASASFWVGLGGFGSSGNGNTPQAGVDAFVYSNGGVGYNYWIEDNTPGNDYIFTYVLNAKCGTQMYVEVDSPLNGDSVYYVVDGGGSNESYTPGWPTTDGASAECFVEDPHPSGQPFQPLADFNYIAFSNCYINGLGIGSRSHSTYTMLDTNNQVMASPGSISNAGANFNVNWKKAN